MKYRNRKYILFLLAFLSMNLLQAQEVLTGLTHNPQIMGQPQVKTRNVTSVILPFFDDFSNYTGAPKSSLWADRQAFVNNSYPMVPPSIGVVTLDALDENGLIFIEKEAENAYSTLEEMYDIAPLLGDAFAAKDGSTPIFAYEILE